LDSTVKIVEDGRGTEFKAVDDLGFDERKDFGEGGKGSLRFLQR
jgi:hypothetical protein